MNNTRNIEEVQQADRKFLEEQNWNLEAEEYNWNKKCNREVSAAD